MKVAMASDSFGFPLKESVKRNLEDAGYEIVDVGPANETEPMMFYDSAAALAREIQQGHAERGIVICGTGAGVSLIANKFKGVYCVACESLYSAGRISLVNHANVLAMGANMVGASMGCDMARTFLENQWCQGFDPERKARNVNGFEKLRQIEAEQMK